MPGPFFILSSVPISQEELSNFTCALKGVTTSDVTLSNVLSSGRRHVWFGLSSEAELESEKKKFENGALAYLGNRPETCITVEVSDEEGSSYWALEIAILILKTWKSVVDDFHGPMLTLSDLESLKASGRAFLSGERF